MARKEPQRFVAPDGAAREAEAAKTTRLRALRLVKEAEDAKEKQEAADRQAAEKRTKATVRRRVRAPQAHPPILS